MTAKKIRRKPAIITNCDKTQKEGIAGWQVRKIGGNAPSFFNLKIEDCPNREKTKPDTEDGNDTDDEWEIPEATGERLYDTFERDECYMPIRTNPENDVIQIYTDGN